MLFTSKVSQSIMLYLKTKKTWWHFNFLHKRPHCIYAQSNFNLLTGRKEMFYLTTHSILYAIRNMVKDHSDSERVNLLLPQGLLFPISSKGSFICTIPHTTVFVAPVVKHWLEREIAQWVRHEGSIRRSIVPWANALTTELHLAPPIG